MNIDEALRTKWPKTGKTIEDSLRAEQLNFTELRTIANEKDQDSVHEASRFIWKNYEEVYARVHPRSVTIFTGLPNAELSLEEARREPYPFREIRGIPMGRLLDERKISTKDLGYCLAQNLPKRTREAIRVLLFKELQSPVTEAEDRGVPEVVSGGDSWSREQIDNFLIGLGVIGGYGIGILFATLLIDFFPRFHQGMWLEGIGFFTASGGMIFFAALRMKSLHANQIGLEEEANVLSLLRAGLDKRWTIFTNLRPKGFKGGDLDAVLVGPPGVYVLEIKHWNTEVKIHGEAVVTGTKHTGEGKTTPILQAKRGAMHLHKLLEKKDLNQFVTPVVVMNAKALEIEKPAIAIWNVRELPETLSDLNDSEAPTSLEIEKVRVALKTIFK